ncbi:MAG: hypothetical protein ACK559_31135, partial [bacterium]
MQRGEGRLGEAGQQVQRQLTRRAGLGVIAEADDDGPGHGPLPGASAGAAGQVHALEPGDRANPLLGHLIGGRGGGDPAGPAEVDDA